MSIRPVTRFPRQNNPISIRNFLGVDVTATRDVRRSPDMLNCILDDEGTPEMRTGYEEALDASLGAGAILGVHKFGTHWIIHHGANLYKLTALGGTPASVYTSMGGSTISRSFKMANKLVIFDGTTIVLWDGTTATAATASAYTPTFLINCDATGAGDRYEDYNLLKPSWKLSYSTVAATLAYAFNVAALTSVDSVVLNGTTLTETTDYTVNLTTGIVTLIADPGNGTNNLIMQATKTGIVDSDLILNCTVAGVFGGPSDSKVFLTGNPDFPHLDWWTSLDANGNYDPTYWPDTNSDNVGGDENDPIVGYSVQWDTMIVKKQNSIWLRGWELTTDAYGRTVMRFPATILSYTDGCCSTDSIATLKGVPTYLGLEGLYQVIGTNVRDERNVEPASTLTNIEGAGDERGVDFKGRYYLALGDTDKTVWVCDYTRAVVDEASGEYQPVWYRWTGVPANVWCVTDEENLLFGSDTIGMVYRFKEKTEDLPYNDDGSAINAYFTTILTAFNRDDLTKLVQSVMVKAKPWSRSEIQMEYFTEEGASGIVDAHREVLFDWGDIDFGDFSFETSQIAKSYKVRIDDARGIQLFKVALYSSGVADEFFGFRSIDISYQTLSEVRE